MDKINKIMQGTKSTVLGNKITIANEDWDFVINIAKQHARISDTTLAALEEHDNTTDTIKRCQSLYLAVAAEVAALGYADQNKITQRVQENTTITNQ